MTKNNFFPFFIDLTGKNILVIGAGKVAARKITTLLSLGAHILIYTKQIKDKSITSFLFDKKNIQLIMKEIKEENFKGFITKDAFMVIAATDDKKLNEQITNYCRDNNILINNVSSNDNMTVRFCSVIENQNYKIGISANGDPKKSLVLKNKIEKFLENKN